MREDLWSLAAGLFAAAEIQGARSKTMTPPLPRDRSRIGLISEEDRERTKVRLEPGPLARNLRQYPLFGEFSGQNPD